MSRNQRRILAIIGALSYGLALGLFADKSTRYVAYRLAEWADDGTTST